ncbi:unnamed protein product [Prorocentrum cordatum]|uniref:Subtilisin n=1 Tax=Prorocentrum cordatum TaxID=2364126 RepID=A0ABN9S338_9DINO|nr:unnamed protein product [Polarella glacialis]
MYRAGGEADYDLENVNAADLEGVLWYLHNEVVASAPRKYGIDRIRRYQVTIKNTQEFWNVHKKQFGPFLAFDAARCTTVDGMGASTCESVFQKYGFIVGCQPVQSAGAADQAPLGYLHDSPSNTGCAPGTQDCYAPLWYSLPGPCPEFGIPQDAIDANDADQDVAQYKSAECKWRMPGGRCEKANGAPDCTYSVWPAGEIMLDDLSGIDDYQDWWNVSYYRCIDEGGTDCAQNKEYDVLLDAGVGTSFWDNRGDRDACKAAAKLGAAATEAARQRATEQKVASAPAAPAAGDGAAGQFAEWSMPARYGGSVDQEARRPAGTDPAATEVQSLALHTRRSPVAAGVAAIGLEQCLPHLEPLALQQGSLDGDLRV